MSDDWLLYYFSFPRMHVVIVDVLEVDVEGALDELREKSPDEYALLMEHLPIERRRSE
jgi:hypothetical protein